MSTIKLAILFLVLLIIPAFAEDISDSWIEEHWAENAASTSGAGNSNDQAMPDIADFNIIGQEPHSISLASGEVPYSDYTTGPRSNELWIRSNDSWARYIQIHQGEDLELVAYVAAGSTADLYRVFYTDSIVSHKSYDVTPGYYSLMINAAALGRTMLFLSVDNQPSNAVIIDVIAPAESSSGPVDVGRFSPAEAKVTIDSNWLSGYSISVDGVPYSSDKADGSADGVARFTISGDRTHTLTVIGGASFGSQPFRRDYTRSFKSSYAYTLKI